jgi:hypothetical protein
MSKRLEDLADKELGKYMDKIARAGEAARVAGGQVPAVVEHAAEDAASEFSARWGLK